MKVTAWPPSQIVSSSNSIATRPSRPTQRPWQAMYERAFRTPSRRTSAATHPLPLPHHRIFRDAIAWCKRAHFQVGARFHRVEAEHVDPRDADRVQRRELVHVGREGSDGVTARELKGEPHGSDIYDRCALNVGPRHAQTVDNRIEMRLGRFTKFRLWKREEQPLAVDLDVDQTLAALLHQPASRPRLEATAQYGVRRPDRGMARLIALSSKDRA